MTSSIDIYTSLMSILSREIRKNLLSRRPWTVGVIASYFFFLFFFLMFPHFYIESSIVRITYIKLSRIMFWSILFREWNYILHWFFYFVMFLQNNFYGIYIYILFFITIIIIITFSHLYKYCIWCEYVEPYNWGYLLGLRHNKTK